MIFQYFSRQSSFSRIIIIIIISFKKVLYIQVLSSLCDLEPLYFLSRKCSLLMTYAAKIQVHFRQDFIMEKNTMNPDQTASLGAV